MDPSLRWGNAQTWSSPSSVRNAGAGSPARDLVINWKGRRSKRTCDDAGANPQRSFSVCEI
jgi:hypothetical protein